MINNFDKFPRQFVSWEYYFVQILNRKISWSNNKNRCIKTYYIDTQEYLNKKVQEMIIIAQATSSRIYIYPVRRRYKDIAMWVMTLLFEYIKNNDFSWLPRILDSASGKSTWVERLWIVDVDDKESLQSTIDHIKSIRPHREPEYILETVKWWHIVTKPFDVSQYKLQREIKKNNPTLLFATTI
jgi:hypothetical protein